MARLVLETTGRKSPPDAEEGGGLLRHLDDCCISRVRTPPLFNRGLFPARDA